MFTLDELEAAHELVLRALRRRRRSPGRCSRERLGAEAIVKHENHNPTGAFKVRGGLTYVDALKRRAPRDARRWSRRRAAITARASLSPRAAPASSRSSSSRDGNSREKNAAMRALGAELVEHGADFQAAREEAISASRDAEGWSWCPRSIAISCAASRLIRSSFCGDTPISTCSTCRSARARGSAAHRRARRAGAQDRDRRRAGDERAGLCAVVRRRPRGARPTPPTRSPTAWRRACPTRRRSKSSCAASRASSLVSDDEIADAVRAYWTDTHNLAEGAGAAPLAAAMQGAAAPARPQGRPRALRRQHRFRSVSKLDRGSAERRGGVNSKNKDVMLMSKAYPPSPYSPRRSASDNVESHTLSVLVDNEPGVLARVVGLCSRRLVQHREPDGRRSRA